MNLDMKQVYQSQKEISILKGISALLDWDENTNMPGSAFRSRSEQIKLVEGLINERLTDEQLAASIAGLRKERLTKTEIFILNELEKEVNKAKRFPPAQRQALAKQLVLSRDAWKSARKANNFSLFERQLSTIIEMKKKQALLLEPAQNPYDTLIKEYEEGMDTSRYESMFKYLRQELVLLISKITATKRFKEQKALELKIAKRDQTQIIDDFIKVMGITPERVRISTSPHPFTTRISINDVRITTRYADPMESFFTVLHEAGHALYEMNLPKKYYHTLVYSPASFGMDEAQAMIWEYQIGKNPALWQSYYLTFRKYIEKLIRWNDFYFYINMVNPSFIRVNADEVTYILHIILRFEIEKELINNRMKASDIRAAWNQKMNELLGITPRNDNEGLLQDIHWATGDFGYFPSYALGAIYSTQLSRQMFKEIPNSEQLIKTQDFSQFIEWLKKKVYHKGKTRSAETILKNATGSGLKPKVYIDYLNEKYSKLYGFK